VKISVVQDIMHNIDRRGDRGMCCNYASSHNIVHTFTIGVFADDIRFAYLKIMGGECKCSYTVDTDWDEVRSSKTFEFGIEFEIREFIQMTFRC
jgi:hypothetical protein